MRSCSARWTHGEQDRDDGYVVRAIFDNASSLVQGEDVKIAGAAVGVVETLDVTDDKKAAVVLQHRRRRLHALPQRTRTAPSGRSR